jgi:hypothetical protein
VVDIGHADGGDSVPSRPQYDVVGGQSKRRHTQSIAAIHQVGTTFGPAQVRLGPRGESAGLGTLGVPIEAEDAMRVHATQVGVDQVFGNLTRDGWLAPDGLHHARAEARECIRGNQGVVLRNHGRGSTGGEVSPSAAMGM